MIPDHHGRAVIAHHRRRAMIPHDDGRAVIAYDRRGAMVADDSTALTDVAITSPCRFRCGNEC